MSGYPSRPPFFAHRVVRMMQKTCAANVMGLEGCWLVTCIAHVEDAKRYTKPVSFWNEQLMPIAGFRSWGRLDRARKAAVEAGWLIYRPGKIRGSGTYWTDIPEHATSLDDSPIDESHDHHFGAHEPHDHQNEAHNGDTAVMRRRCNGEPSIPTPIPVPISSDQFDQFWNTYGKKIGRAKCEPKFFKAVRSVAKQKKVSAEDASDLIISRAADYAAQFTGDNQYQMNPLTWINGEHWDDEHANGTTCDFADVHRAVVDHYQPDVKDTAAVQAALTPTQFAAAKSVGLDRIARSRADDKRIATEYRRAIG